MGPPPQSNRPLKAPALAASRAPNPPSLPNPPMGGALQFLGLYGVQTTTQCVKAGQAATRCVKADGARTPPRADPTYAITAQK